MDAVVARWWDEEVCEKDIIDATWYDLDNFLRACFLSSSNIQKLLNDVNKQARLLSKKVATRHLLSPAKEVKKVVPVKTVSATITKISEKQQPDVPKVVGCAETVVEKVEPLSGLNMQLKKVHDGACMTAERSQRWSFFRLSAL